MKIALDTSFLIMSVEYKVDIFRMLKGNRLFLISPVKEELEKIAGGKGKKKRFAKVVLQMLARKRMRTVGTRERSADRALFMLSKKGYGIATQDRMLMGKIRKSRGKVLYIRQKKYVVFE